MCHHEELTYYSFTRLNLSLYTSHFLLDIAEILEVVYLNSRFTQIFGRHLVMIIVEQVKMTLADGFKISLIK